MNTYYSNNEFDINKFNKTFDEIQRNKINEENDEEELKLLNKEINKKNVGDMRLGSIFSNMKDEVFGTIYDMLSFNYENSYSEIFTKNNRLFYIGIFLILICIILYLISYLFYYPKPKDKNFNFNANIGIPKDYKFSYYPYKKQDAQEIIDNRKTIETLKKKLVDSKLKIKELEKNIITPPNIEYEVDNDIVDSDMIPTAVKEQLQTQVKNEMLNN